MHELAITQGVVDAVVERMGANRVTAVRLEIGRLSGVLADAVRFCFDLVTEGTSLEGARLDIDEPDGRARCRTCVREFEVAGPIVLCACGSADVEVLTGRELCLRSVEVA